MSSLGFGTLQAGDRSFFTDTDPNEYRKILKRALSMGFRHFDTAYSYREAETLLGAAIKDSGIDREEITITDKIMSVPTLERKAEASLKRLKCDYIDYLLLHWPTGNEKLIYDSLKTLEKLQERGLIEHFGISNFTVDMTSRLSSDFDIAAIERPVSLLWTKDLFTTIELAKRKDIMVFGYSPLGMGILLGKKDFSDDRKNLPCLARPELDDLINEIERLSLVKKTSKANICLSWALSTGADLIFIGASKMEQLDNLLEPIMLSDSEKLSLEMKADALSSSLVYDNLYGHNWKEM